MSGHGLSEDQVAGELNKMVEFIKKEADEKAKEIELKANEEYEIEKANIVRSETAAIDALFERKYKQSSLEKQIAKSTVANQVRLKVLGAKEAVLSELVQEAEKKLTSISKDKTKYETILAGLIEEGLLALLESTVTVKVRESDVAIAEKAGVTAAKNYEEKTQKTVTISVDKKNYLPSQSAGGVVIVNGSGKIDVDNTLEERLRLLSDSALPAVRLALFGPSASRKFFD